MSDDFPELSTDPRALRVYKKPIPLQATFALADGVCKTLEGPVRFRAGDAILTGSRGEHWPVGRGLFLSSYEPVPPTRAGENGRYRKAPAVAHAIRLDRPREVPVGWQNDPLHGQPGDWLLRYADGSHGVVQDAIFRETYAPAPGETRWPP
ncbi:MAG TPA: PGDYG domain-containing protein [Xanthobacteraceae bacterium]|nr:PGDYG domain-containing protein [Xanthobacteraceae bacterium]